MAVVVQSIPSTRNRFKLQKLWYGDQPVSSSIVVSLRPPPLTSVNAALLSSVAYTVRRNQNIRRHVYIFMLLIKIFVSPQLHIRSLEKCRADYKLSHSLGSFVKFIEFGLHVRPLYRNVKYENINFIGSTENSIKH